jgi:hypothetical protein
VFDVLCFNSGNSKNESKGDCVNVREEKATIVVTHFMDGHTILCIQDVKASSTKDPSYHFGGQEMESHFHHNDNLEVSPSHVFFVLKVV